MLAVRRFLVQIGKPGKNINSEIQELVVGGLSPKVQQALDLLRVVGNNAVHPGEINFEDNVDVAWQMFKILNVIADDLISKPNEIDRLYNELLPPKAREHIQKRDSK